MPTPAVKAARERCAASHTSRIGLAVSGAYERYSCTPKPSRPLLATKQGWPSVMPVSISWKEAFTSSADGICGLVSLKQVPERVEEISSR